MDDELKRQISASMDLAADAEADARVVRAMTEDPAVEAWARDANNPVRGYCGLRKGYRGRFANYVPPVLELLGLVELEHNTRNNRVRAR